jgi:nucleoside-diphosphate-sugar epimerase
MTDPILVTGAAGRVGAVGRTVTELLLKEGRAVRAMVRKEDERAQALRDMGAEVIVGDLLDLVRCIERLPAAKRCTSACRFQMITWLRQSIRQRWRSTTE